MEEPFLVSVCIAVFNRAKFIKNAIDSVLSQSYQNFEIIVINDGSTDDTLSVIDAIKDNRIKVFNNDQNRGVTFTRNRYLAEAEGDLIAILDSDDQWLVDKLRKQVDYILQNPNVGILGTFATRVFDDGTTDTWKYPTSDIKIRERLFFGSTMIHSSLIVKRSIIEAENICYDESLKQGEDYDFIRQIVKYTQVENLNESLIKYYLHDNQFTSTAKQEQIDESFKVAHRYTIDLNIKLNGDSLEVYKRAFYYQLSFSKEELHLLQSVFVSFKKSINQSDKTTKDSLVSERWFMACYYSCKIGMNAFLIYLKSKELRNENMMSFNNLKFVFKCLVRR